MQKLPLEKESVLKEHYLKLVEKKLSVRKVAAKFGLTYSFLYRRLSGEVEIDSRNGPQTVFTSKEEEAMATWLKEMAERGMGLKPGECLDFIQKMVQTEKRETPFINGRPGYDWYRAFLARNSHIIQIRQDSALESCRAKVTKESIDKWFTKFKEFILSSDLQDKPKRIFNADETGGKVIGPLKRQTA